MKKGTRSRCPPSFYTFSISMRLRLSFGQVIKIVISLKITLCQSLCDAKSPDPAVTLFRYTFATIRLLNDNNVFFVV